MPEPPPNIALKLSSALVRVPWRPSAAKAAARWWRLQLNAAFDGRQEEPATCGLASYGHSPNGDIYGDSAVQRQRNDPGRGSRLGGCRVSRRPAASEVAPVSGAKRRVAVFCLGSDSGSPGEALPEDQAIQRSLPSKANGVILLAG
jgi:hypothetical protein